MSTRTPITVAYGDGIGPEIMVASLHILQEAGALLEIETIEIGERVYIRDSSAGIEPSSWDAIRRTKVFYKAPVTTPQGAGFKSLHVSARKMLGLYANVRPCISYHPFVDTRHPDMKVVIIRENAEDLYGGIEYQLSPNVVEALKVMSRPGSERVCRSAFEFARQYNRRKVTCFTKDNMMKLTDGMFHKVFDEVAADYPGIDREHVLVDEGAAKLADTPEIFDVVVMPNLYGDILSDLAAQIAGSVGLAGSSSLGTQAAVFEAIHGSAPRLAGQNVVNPSGLLLAGVMMLVHIDQTEVAERVHNAWLRTIEDGIHTYDIYKEGSSKHKVSTKEFAAAVASRLGQAPENLKPARYRKVAAHRPEPAFRTAKAMSLVGIDVFVCHASRNTQELAAAAAKANGAGLTLQWIDNRGVKVWPNGLAQTFCTDSYRCRFMAKDHLTVSPHQVTALLDRVAYSGLTVVKTEYLHLFDGRPGFSFSS